MINIRTSLNNAGLGGKIKISTAIETGALAVFCPPSHGAFQQSYLSILNPLTQFRKDSGSPLLVNLYPYFSYNQQPTEHIPPILALHVTNDDGLKYQNLFDAIFEMFDEDQKSPDNKKYFGLFMPNKQPKYLINFS